MAPTLQMRLHPSPKKANTPLARVSAVAIPGLSHFIYRHLQCSLELMSAPQINEGISFHALNKAGSNTGKKPFQVL